jgi:hypothetical protein
MEIIPDKVPQKNKKTTIFTLETYWKKGKITKMQLDDIDVTDQLNEEKQKRLETILKCSKRFRPGFQGSIKLIITKNDGRIVKLRWSASNIIYEER